MLVLVSQCLTGRQMARMELDLFGLRIASLVLLPFQDVTGRGDLAVVLEQLLEELRAQDADLGEQKLALHQGGVGVVEDGPDGDEVVQLSAGLFDDTVLALQHDGHARQILDLGVADDQAVDVEAPGSQNSRHAGQHTGLILHQAVQDVTLRRIGRCNGGLVQNRRHGRGSVPLRGGIVNRERERRATVQGLVGQCRGRARRGSGCGESGKTGCHPGGFGRHR